MTKETYYEMCHQLGTEPKDDEIPIELDEFPLEIQQVFLLYENLGDKISEMQGIYMGKVYDSFPLFHSIFCSDIDFVYCLRLVRYIDSLVVEQALKKHKAANKVEIPKA